MSALITLLVAGLVFLYLRSNYKAARDGCKILRFLGSGDPSAVAASLF